MNRASTVLMQREGASIAGPFPLHSHPAHKFSLTDGDQFPIMKLSSVASLRPDRHHSGIVIDIRSECLIGIIGIRNNLNGMPGMQARRPNPAEPLLK